MLFNWLIPIKSIKHLCYFLLIIFSIGKSFAQFVHPGITHKLSDLDRMKYMVEAGIEPWATTFQNLSNHARAQYDYAVNVVNQDPSYVIEFSPASDGWFNNDGTAAYYNALMWYITGDSRHADKAVEILNTYKGLRRNTTGIPLESGRVWRIIEAAEIIAHTYNGWAASDIQDFKDMLVYPGYSNTTVPTAAINSNDITFYWKIYQGDPSRHGNQGLFAMRTMMAIGIFLDNEIIYERALRYLQGQSHRSDDLAYPSGPPINNNEITSCQFFDEFTQNGFQSTVQDYGYNEVVSNYIFENGQSQESSRDQAHAIAGVSTIAVMAEMAWSQGDDLYGHLNNRPLLGLEFFYRYNLTSTQSYPDQPNSWEPTVASGEYIERTDRSGRWRSKLINPGVNCNQNNITRGGANILQPVPEMNLGHYRDRLLLPSDDYKWLQRGHDYITSQIGVENEGTVTDHPGYGGLKFRRVSPGDPISGFDNNGLPIYAMNVLPMTIEAENFDYFTTSGEDRTYNDTDNLNRGEQYRTDERVDIQTSTEGGYNIGWIQAGEYLTYTVYVPETGSYSISARVASISSNGEIRVDFDGIDKTGNVSVPNTGGWQSWQTLNISNNVTLTKGVQQMKVVFPSAGLNINNITINSNNAQSTTPVAGKTYYIDNPHWDLRLGANGSQDAYTTSTNTTGPNVEWTITASPTANFFYVDCNGGGSAPRIRTDRTENADMQATSSAGTWTRWEFTNTGNNTFFMTVLDNSNYERLQVNNSGQVKMVSETSAGTWETFTFTEVTNPSAKNAATKNNDKLEGKIKLFPNPTSNTVTITGAKNSNINIYNINGKVIFSKSIFNNNEKLDISNLSSGFYYAEILNSETKSVIKLIKK